MSSLSRIITLLLLTAGSLLVGGSLVWFLAYSIEKGPPERLRLEAVEARIRNNRDRTSLLTLLESLAGRASVKIDSMEERKSPPNDHYRETRVEVTLKSVTLTQVVNYLHSVESSGRMLSVKSLRIRTRADDPALLDVNFSVSTFEPA